MDVERGGSVLSDRYFEEQLQHRTRVFKTSSIAATTEQDP